MLEKSHSESTTICPTCAHQYEVLHAKMMGHWALDEERWAGHAREHTSIARNLSEYKAQSNEWRGSLADLRATFSTKSDKENLEIKIDSLEKSINQEREDRLTDQNIRTGAVNTWKWIAGFLGVGGASAVIYALMNAPK